MRVIAVILEPRAPCGILEVSCSCVSPQEQDSSQSPERIAHEQPRRGAVPWTVAGALAGVFYKLKIGSPAA